MDMLTTNLRPEVRADLRAEYDRWSGDIRHYCQPDGRFAPLNKEYALLAASLAIFNRRMVLIVDGVARFHRRLRSHNVQTLTIGNAEISPGTARRYEEAVAGFNALVQRLGVDPGLLETTNAFEMLEAMLLGLETEGDNG